MRFFCYGLILIGLTLSVVDLDQRYVVSGNKLKPKYLSAPRINQEVISAYSVDTSYVLKTLRQYRGLYYIGAALHGVYFGLK